MVPNSLYVPLAEIAKKWNYPEDELIRWAMQDIFNLYCVRQSPRGMYLFFIIGKELEYFLGGGNSISCSDFRYPAGYLNLRGSNKKSVIVDRSDLYLHADEIAYLERNYSYLAGEKTEQFVESNIGEEAFNTLLVSEKEMLTSGKIENTDLYIIGGLTAILKGQNANNNRILPYKTDAAIIKDLVFHLKGLPGASKRNIDGRIELANMHKGIFPIQVRVDIYIIGALIDLLMGKHVNKKLPFKNDDEIITALLEVFKNRDGVEKEILKCRFDKAEGNINEYWGKEDP